MLTAMQRSQTNGHFGPTTSCPESS